MFNIHNYTGNANQNYTKSFRRQAQEDPALLWTRDLTVFFSVFFNPFPCPSLSIKCFDHPKKPYIKIPPHPGNHHENKAQMRVGMWR
jgi:hypothetical protein